MLRYRPGRLRPGPELGADLEEVEKMAGSIKGSGTRQTPWVLKTPPGTSEFQAFRDPALDPPALVVTVGKTKLRYQLRCLDDLHAMLKKRGDWMALGSRRTEAHRRGHGRSLGSIAEEPGRRLVRPEEGIAWTLRDVRAPGHGSYEASGG